MRGGIRDIVALPPNYRRQATQRRPAHHIVDLGDTHNSPDTSLQAGAPRPRRGGRRKRRRFLGLAPPRSIIHFAFVAPAAVVVALLRMPATSRGHPLSRRGRSRSATGACSFASADMLRVNAYSFGAVSFAVRFARPLRATAVHVVFGAIRIRRASLNPGQAPPRLQVAVRRGCSALADFTLARKRGAARDCLVRHARVRERRRDTNRANVFVERSM